MFADSLLESSPATRKRKRWPMATAFTVETIIAAVVVIVPLLSTGVIPLSARVQRPPVSLTRVPVEPVKPAPNNQAPRSGTGTSAPRAAVVPVSNNLDRITFGPAKNPTSEGPDARPDTNIGSNNPIPNLGPGGDGSNVRLGPKRVPVSELSPAQILNRVDPVYPRMAVISGVQGDVKLHAIISRDGRIISLSVISGHPLLARAAEDAVSQWRYRPYILNGEAVEVETFVTVHFTRDQR